jgi:hypothetical protein
VSSSFARPAPVAAGHRRGIFEAPTNPRVPRCVTSPH